MTVTSDTPILVTVGDALAFNTSLGAFCAVNLCISHAERVAIVGALCKGEVYVSGDWSVRLPLMTCLRESLEREARNAGLL